MKRRFTAVLCAIALLAAMLCTPGMATERVCFTAVNDRLMPLQADAMPAWVNGLLYVPSTVFDRSVTTVDFGMQYNYSRSSNTVTLYNLNQMLVFDLAKGTSYDQISGKVMPRAVNRTGRIYLPVVAVCDFFGLDHYYTQTQSGYLLRISNDAAWLSNEGFLDAASMDMANQLQKYQDSLKPVQPPQLPEPPADDTPQSRVQVCIGVRCTGGDGLQRILNTMDRAGWRGAFFFEPDSISVQDDLVRRVVGSGHTVGLLTQGADASTNRQALAQGNHLLAVTAYTAATAVHAPAEQRQELEGHDWVCWQDTVNGSVRSGERAAAYAQRMVNAMGTGRRTVYLTLDDSAATAQVLSTLLGRLEQDGYTMLSPLETRM